MLAARSGSPVRVYNPLSAQDTHSTRDAVCALGAVVEEASDHWLVHAKRLGPPDRAMDCGNSGTTLRLMTAQAAMMPATIDLVGDSSLSRRPNQPLLDALRALGAEVESTQGRAPIRVRGPLRGGDVSLPGRLSSQFASALVLALPFAEFGSVVTVESPVHSRPYLDLTIAMAQQAGLSVVLSEFAGGDLQVAIPGQQSVSASK